MGRLNAMKRLNVGHFKNSSLGKRIKNLIVEEEKKKEEKDEKILIDLCECYLLFYYEYDDLPKTMTNICVPPLLKVASNKDESKETQKEAETALLALGNVGDFIIPEELYLSEIKEIILYHQEHRHLTQIAYQSAWQFLIKRFVFDESLEGVIVNEMHFVREASKGLEKLMKHEDWKKKQKEAKKEKGIGKEPEEEHMMMKWLFAIGRYLTMCKLWNEESVLLVDSIVRLLRAARDINMDMSECCVNILYGTVMNRTMKIEGILKGWSFDAVLEEIQSQTLNRHLMKCLKFFLVISKRMKEKEKDEKEETKRKSTKKKVFVKMEEEGYEDIITSFHVVSRILKYRYDDSLSDYYADYFF
ncbi:uncharacterized protein MONOS_10925 [Monocercomonoides exilis]|uniref:uncharacterized protein n=1 Tax=Monocercomonoides exilis TaxID=2049356 RepID=UPI00355937B3|nr:hypothetical protein MONOS_10925 [Monocercomonoides exilis]|eukprot:MONOS_10925.1-p1 / transcript=MONOS_10925.1 / gene=MONOS_10925 / organism=Monocercomonoides_exilis_PA203 / gene_product=unspecified product / transcript_product=unspecified product / location=Mono_scaffold00519:21665-22804(-) / protein_length=359 / sequence_SO=supercontig / SO=protein_coding / is_pseudo=false